jgi:hypothetical protein
VKGEEIVAFAIFSNTATQSGKLVPEAFRSKDLRRGEVSLARVKYTTLAEFVNEVIEPGEKNSGSFHGACCALAANIRAISVDASPNKTGEMSRGFCVLDKVSPHDHDGHAAIEFAELPGPISEPRLKALRELIKGDLVRVFGAIEAADRIFCSSLAAS